MHSQLPTFDLLLNSFDIQLLFIETPSFLARPVNVLTLPIFPNGHSIYLISCWPFMISFSNIKPIFSSYHYYSNATHELNSFELIELCSFQGVYIYIYMKRNNRNSRIEWKDISIVHQELIVYTDILTYTAIVDSPYVAKFAQWQLPHPTLL